MKQILTYVFLVLLAVGCTTEMEKAQLEPLVPAEEIIITQTATEKANVYTFTTELKGAILNWNFGNGSRATGSEVTASYPFKGDYTVTLTTIQQGGQVAKEFTISILEDNYELVNDPMFLLVSGGIEAVDGKTWVIDSTQKGHIGCGPDYLLYAEWYNASPLEKTGMGIYDDKLNFKLKDAKIDYINNGNTFTALGAKDGMVNRGAICPASPDGDFIAQYTPDCSDWSWSLSKDGETGTLNFPSMQAFAMFYQTESNNYEITLLNEDEMHLRLDLPGIRWYFMLIREGYERPLPPPAEPKAIELAEDFEDKEQKVAFTSQEPGSRMSFAYANPAPVPVNESDSVMLYHKSTQYYTNVFFQAPYKFDLTEINKVTCKVFVPSYNDYTTENEVVGNWIENNLLKPQLAVKLQDGSLADDAWTTQTEIVEADIPTDKWVELTFDFSEVSSRVDYDKIVIQFGAEGHAGAGIFFLDDFTFHK